MSDGCRRRCEPSPLVPPTHPDAAKLPCARCRRFALECVRVKVTRKKGPAPVYVCFHSSNARNLLTTLQGSKVRFCATSSSLEKTS